jgi:hypothetical protein
MLNNIFQFDIKTFKKVNKALKIMVIDMLDKRKEFLIDLSLN